MAHSLVRGRGRSESFRRQEVELSSYRFARGQSALHRASCFLKALVQSVADAKFRRMVRELELRGMRLDMRDELWTPGVSPGRAERAGDSLDPREAPQK